MYRLKRPYLLIGENPICRLTFFSLLFLLLPNLIFVIGWFRWELVLPAISILLVSFHLFLENLPAQSLSKDKNLSNQQNVVVAVIALLVCVISGIGGFTFQGDQDKHYGVLRDLITQPWPVVYEENFLVSSAAHLNYYLGYYLPVGWLSKTFGLGVADLLIFIWTFLGVYLVLRWVLVWRDKNSILLAMAIFLFFGGQDFLYASLKIPVKWLLLGEWIPRHVFEMEIAAEAVVHNNILQFYSPIVSMTWCPQHVIGGWLATALIYHQFTSTNSLKNTAFITALTFIWSIFNSIGLAILLIIILIKRGFKPFISFQNVLGAGVLTFLVGFYFEAHYSISESLWIWEAIPGKSWLPKIIVFLIIEFGIYALLSYQFVSQQKWKLIWWASVIVLCIIPFYVIGLFNDFLMRAAVPSLFIISVVFIQFFSKTSARHKYTLFFLFLLLGNIPYFTLRYVVKDRVVDQTSVANSISVSKIREEKWFNSQYLGDNKSIYWQYLSPK